MHRFFDESELTARHNKAATNPPISTHSAECITTIWRWNRGASLFHPSRSLRHTTATGPTYCPHMLSGAGKYTRKVLTYLVNEWNSNHYHHHLPPTGCRGFERTCACCDPDLSFSGTLPWATHKSQWPDRREEEEKWEQWRSAVRGRAPLRSTLPPTSVFSTLKWDGEHSHGARSQVLQAVHWIFFLFRFFQPFYFLTPQASCVSPTLLSCVRLIVSHGAKSTINASLP